MEPGLHAVAPHLAETELQEAIEETDAELGAGREAGHESELDRIAETARSPQLSGQTQPPPLDGCDEVLERTSPASDAPRATPDDLEATQLEVLRHADPVPDPESHTQPEPNLPSAGAPRLDAPPSGTQLDPLWSGGPHSARPRCMQLGTQLDPVRPRPALTCSPSHARPHTPILTPTPSHPHPRTLILTSSHSRTQPRPVSPLNPPLPTPPHPTTTSIR